MSTNLPTMEEVALGVFLHDIGKFLQRARGGNAALPERVRKMENLILPQQEGR